MSHDYRKMSSLIMGNFTYPALKGLKIEGDSWSIRITGTATHWQKKRLKMRPFVFRKNQWSLSNEQIEIN